MQTTTTPNLINTLPRHRKPEERVAAPAKRTTDDYKKMIRGLNLKVTDQRLQILEALDSGRNHVTAQEVYELILIKDPTVGFATVYRFLRKLTEAAYVTEVRVGGMPARYELMPVHHHDHLTCTHCGKISEFENDAIEELQIQEAKKLGFVLTHHVLELYGVCADCQRREAKLSQTLAAK